MNKQARNKLMMKIFGPILGIMFLGTTIYSTIGLFNSGPQGVEREVQQLVYDAKKDLEVKQFDRAKNALARAIELSPNHPDAHRVLGNLYFKDRKWLEAQVELEKVVASDKTDIQTYFNLALCYSFLNKLDLAENSYLKVLSLDSSNVLARTNLGVVYLNQKKYEEAKTLLLKALRIQSDFPDIHRNLGVLYKETGDKEKALAHFVKYLKLSPQANDVAQIKQLIVTLTQKQD